MVLRKPRLRARARSTACAQRQLVRGGRGGRHDQQLGRHLALADRPGGVDLRRGRRADRQADRVQSQHDDQSATLLRIATSQGSCGADNTTLQTRHRAVSCLAYWRWTARALSTNPTRMSTGRSPPRWRAPGIRFYSPPTATTILIRRIVTPKSYICDRRDEATPSSIPCPRPVNRSRGPGVSPVASPHVSGQGGRDL